MALVKCKECGGSVSTKAVACPACGAQRPRRTSLLTWVVTALVVAAVGAWIVGGDGLKRSENVSKAARSVVQAVQDPKDEADFQFAVIAAKAVRASLKDPASFEIVRAGLIDGGALCLEYRGKNSFGAVTVERIAVTRAGKKGDWNKECGGKSGEDMGRIKYAM